MIERASGDLIGDAASAWSTGSARVRWATRSDPWWGRGYATEAALAVRDYALGELALPELIALVQPGNAASIHVVQRWHGASRDARVRRVEHLLYLMRRALCT